MQSRNKEAGEEELGEMLTTERHTSRELKSKVNLETTPINGMLYVGYVHCFDCACQRDAHHGTSQKPGTEEQGYLRPCS